MRIMKMPKTERNLILMTISISGNGCQNKLLSNVLKFWVFMKMLRLVIKRFI